MINHTLSDAVYNYLFPDQLIPLACKNNLPAIDARIQEIEALASGRQFDGSKRAASKLLTEQVVQLRESCDPPMMWKEIARRMGGKMTTDAARNRYTDYKAAQKAAAMQKEGYAALSGEAIQAGSYTTPPEVQEKINNSDETAPTDQNSRIVQEIETDILPADQPDLPGGKPPQVEEATVRNSRIVQENEEVKQAVTTKRANALTPSEAGKLNGPRIPHEWNDFLLAEKDAGKSLKDIHAYMQSKGVDCSLSDVTNRIYVEKNKRERAKRTSVPQNVAPAQQEAAQDQSQPGAEGAREIARAHPRGAPEEGSPEPKFISRHALNCKVWNLHKEGKTPETISDELCGEGYYYGVERVRRMLLQQGAEL